MSETQTPQTEAAISGQAKLYGMEDKELLELTCQLRARACNIDVSKEVFDYAWAAFNEVLRRLNTIDKLLNHCPECECSTCGEIVCPHGESLHLHHDGCPACCTWENYMRGKIGLSPRMTATNGVSIST